MLLITKLSGQDEPNTQKSFIFSLRGEALSWASITMETNTQVTLNQFIEEIRNRFSSKVKTDAIINHFLSIASAESYNQYMQLLKDANEIYELKASFSSSRWIFK
ncbi:hypothetical protein ENBRE01_2942 [Enteropsectra breve]|nr:hypothetical protein ENBRE01_2942 [Enteropsectra breve]